MTLASVFVGYAFGANAIVFFVGDLTLCIDKVYVVFVFSVDVFAINLLVDSLKLLVKWYILS